MLLDIFSNRTLPWVFPCWRRGQGSLPGAGIGATIETAEAPVRAVEVRHAH